MFRAIFSPIFRSTRLCVTACGIMHPRCCRLVAWKRRNLLKWVPSLPSYRPATSWVHYTTSCNTQSSAPEDGRKYPPKHVELIGFINKLLLFHLNWLSVLFISMMHGQVNIKPQTALLTTSPRVYTVRSKTNGLSWRGIRKALDFIACSVQIMFFVSTLSDLC